MTRGRVFVAVVLVAATAVAVHSVVRPRRSSSAPASPVVATSTAEVVRKTLTEQEEVDGTLGYGDAQPVINRGQGTYTRLPAEGSTLERNGVLYEIDNRPVRLLYGEVPAYRRLAEDTGNGPDVAQLESNLVEMGFAKGLISKPDQKWDTATTAAVKRWEKSIGVDQDGAIEDGEIVFLPGPVRVASHKVDTGSPSQPGATVYEATGTTRLVKVDLDARRQRLVQQGAKVEVVLPDDSATAGTIVSIGSVAKSGGGGDDAGGGGGNDDDDKPTVAVVITLDDPAAGGTLDGAPVDVRLTSATRESVLAVPVNALLALAEGGYGVEVVEGQRKRLVVVETGLFSQGLVEVSSPDLQESMKVVVPK